MSESRENAANALAYTGKKPIKVPINNLDSMPKPSQVNRIGASATLGIISKNKKRGSSKRRRIPESAVTMPKKVPAAIERKTAPTIGANVIAEFATNALWFAIRYVKIADGPGSMNSLT